MIFTYLANEDGLGGGNDEDAALLIVSRFLAIIHTPFLPMTSSGFAWIAINLKPPRVIPLAAVSTVPGGM